MCDRMVIASIPNDLIVLQYEHIDFYEFLKLPRDVYSNDANLDLAIEKVKKIFKRNGWEGDGEITILWLPPFLDQADDENYGTLVWHVKQNNNGTSFLGFSEVIQSARLLEQNRVFRDKGKNVKPISLVYTEEKNMLIQLKKKSRELDEFCALSKKNRISGELKELMLGSLQNEIVSELNDFIDECYLHFLVHVLRDNNPDSIKLRSMSSRINLQEISEDSVDGISNHWLTIHQIISNIWNDFKFLPFKDKFKEIMACIDFNYPPDKISEINKHIVIRNCIQHHKWQLVPDVTRTIGQDKIRILNDQGKHINIEKWKHIGLTVTELKHIIATLEDFCFKYCEYVRARIKERHFLHNYREEDYD